MSLDSKLENWKNDLSQVEQLAAPVDDIETDLSRLMFTTKLLNKKLNLVPAFVPRNLNPAILPMI